MGLLSRKEKYYWIGRGMLESVLFARWTCFYKKTNNIGWDAVCGRMTLFVRCVFLAKGTILLKGADYVGELLFSLDGPFLT